jgi:flagellar protein FliO/FliZ
MSDGDLYVRAAAALVFVLALLGVFALLARRFPGSGVMPSKRQKRLGVVEVAAVDPKRRLVLVRRDQVEHLVLIGGGNDLVIESGIGLAVTPPPAPPPPPVPEDLAPPPRRASRLDEVRF